MQGDMAYVLDRRDTLTIERWRTVLFGSPAREFNKNRSRPFHWKYLR
jgi:hypothetical protein